MPPSDRLTEPGSSTVQKQNPADEGCHFYSRSLILCKSESRRKGCRFLQVIIIIAVRQPHLAPGRYLLAGDQAKESTPAGTVGGHQAGYLQRAEESAGWAHRPRGSGWQAAC